MELNRRDTTRRAEVVRTVLEEIVHGGIPLVTIAGLRDSLQLSPEAATRIVERLVSAGVLIETGEGVWTRVSPQGASEPSPQEKSSPIALVFRASPPIDTSVSVLVLVAVFLLTVALGAALAKGVLTLVLRILIDGQLPTLASFGTAGFLVALIAFWSMAPAIIDTPVAAGLLALVR